MDDIDIGVPYLSDVQVSSTVLRRLQLIAPRTREWDNNPAAMSKEEREELAMMVASTFSRFEDFAIIGMKFLGFDTTWMQLDIAKFMADKRYRKKMVAAQRGEEVSVIRLLSTTLTILLGACISSTVLQEQSTRISR